MVSVAQFKCSKKDLLPTAGQNNSRMMAPDRNGTELEAGNVTGSSTTLPVEQDKRSNDSA